MKAPNIMPKNNIVGGNLAPVHRLKKAEIVWLANHRCKHSHTYLEHYSCYLDEHPQRERIGFLDIESSNLDADFGIILTYCIKDANSDTIYSGAITPKDCKAEFIDKNVVKKLIEDLKRFDRIVTWYGKRFDVPFIRTRALICQLPFPNYGTLKHTDAWFIARYKLKQHSNRLESTCRNILGVTDKTHIEPKYWMRALQGDKKSINYILEHNRYDVLDLEKIYYKLINFISAQDTSI